MRNILAGGRSECDVPVNRNAEVRYTAELCMRIAGFAAGCCPCPFGSGCGEPCRVRRGAAEARLPVTAVDIFAAVVVTVDTVVAVVVAVDVILRRTAEIACSNTVEHPTQPTRPPARARRATLPPPRR